MILLLWLLLCMLIYHYIFDVYFLREGFSDAYKYDVHVYGLDTSFINNFKQEGWTSIDGNLTIYHTNLSDLSFLENVTEVTGNVDIYSNLSLVSLNGLSKLKKIGGYLSISSNHSLGECYDRGHTFEEYPIVCRGYDHHFSSMNALHSLEEIGGYLLIENNGIKNLDGFRNLKKIGDVLMITHNLNLKNIDGLSNLKSVNGYVNICDNTNLMAIPDFITKLGEKDSIQNIQLPENICSQESSNRMFIRPLIRDIY